MEDEDRTTLERFVVDNHELEELEARLAEFNIFEALGMVRQEIRHSSFLAFLLDPSQNHGLGDTFLKRFLIRALTRSPSPPLSPIEVDATDLRGAVVSRETENIDILIADDVAHHLVCAIENKIEGGEHSDQLKRYRDAVATRFPQCRAILVYLTPDGDVPTLDEFIPVSYADVAEIADAVRIALQSRLGSGEDTILRHYVIMLRRHIVSGSDIAELCQKIYGKHKRALDLIFEHRPDLQLALSLRIKQMVEEASDQGLILDRYSKTYIDMAFAEWDSLPGMGSGRGWTSSGRTLLFEFQNGPDNLLLKLVIGPGPQPYREALHQLAVRNPKTFHRALKRLGRLWTQIYRRQLLAPSDYVDADLESITSKVRDGWRQFLEEDFPAIRDAIATMPWPEVPPSS